MDEGIELAQKQACVDYLVNQTEGEKLIVRKVNEFIKSIPLSEEKQNFLVLLSPRSKMKLAVLPPDLLVKIFSLDPIYSIKLLGLNNDELIRMQYYSQDELSKLSKLERGRIQDLLTGPLNDLDKISLVPVQKEDLLRRRIVSRPEQEEALWQYLTAQQRYLIVNNDYLARRQVFLQKDKDIKNCSQNCDLDAFVMASKLYMVDVAKLGIEHLNKIKNKAKVAEYLTDEQADIIISGSDGQIALLEKSLAEIDAAYTLDDVKQDAADLELIWRGVKTNTKLYVAMMMNAQVGLLLDNAGQLENRLNCLIFKMESNGVDSFDILEYSEKISNSLSHSRKMQQKALLSLGTITAHNIDLSRNMTLQSYSLLKEAHDNVKLAFRLISKKGFSLTCMKVFPELDSSEAYKIEILK